MKLASRVIRPEVSLIGSGEFLVTKFDEIRILDAWDLFISGVYYHGVTLIPAWISNHIHYKVWDKFTYPLANFKGTIADVWEWIINVIWHFT